MSETNKFPGFCVTCDGRVGAGHGALTRSASGAWVVRCGGGRVATRTAPQRTDLTTRLPNDGSLVAGAPGGVKHATARRNNRADACMNCGEWIAAGEGELIFCVEDSGCEVHHDESGYHVACLDAAACKTRREEARAARKVAAEEAKARAVEVKAKADAEHAAYGVVKSAAIEGLAPSTARPSDFGGAALGEGRELAKDDSGWYKCRLIEHTLATGERVVVEHANGHDDWRVTYYATPATVRTWLLAYAARVNITVEVATEYWREYGANCSGSEVYAAVLAEAGVTVAYDPEALGRRIRREAEAQRILAAARTEEAREAETWIGEARRRRYVREAREARIAALSPAQKKLFERITTTGLCEVSGRERRSFEVLVAAGLV